LYADETAGLQITNNHFDHNGRGPAGAEVSIPSGNAQRDHDVYLKPANTNVVVTGNCFSNACSHGLQARCGGVISGNWFFNNPIHMSFGLVNGTGPILVGGVTGVIQGNLFVGTRPLGSTPAQPRGYAIEIRTRRTSRSAATRSPTITPRRAMASSSPRSSSTSAAGTRERRTPERKSPSRTPR
jgi:hypothetical protein